MSDVKFDCQHFGQHIVCDAKAAGEQVACPTCQARVVVQQLSLPPRMGASPQLPPGFTKKQRFSAYKVIVATLATIGALIAVSSIGFIIFTATRGLYRGGKALVVEQSALNVFRGFPQDSISQFILTYTNLPSSPELPDPIRMVVLESAPWSRRLRSMVIWVAFSGCAGFLPRKESR